MPKSCRCILDRMVFKGAMTKAERDKIVRNLKTQNEERKTGRWNEDGTCSVCGTYSSLNLSKVKYCPECGAKMEGAEGMTKEEAKAEIRKVFEPAFANYIITALTEGATPSERKTGKWIAEGYYADFTNALAFQCSVCGGRIIDYVCQVYDENPHCKWCGARMEGAEE